MCSLNTAKLSRRENRKVAVEFLYMWEAQKEVALEDLIDLFFSTQGLEESDYSFAKKLIGGVLENSKDIDDQIVAFAKNWKLSRISKVDLAILRMAAYEILYCDDIPKAVSINEAIELGRLYSSEDSKRFLNGILDKLSKNA